VPKFNALQRQVILNIVADLTIKRIPDALIMQHIQNKTGKTISKMTLWNIRQRIKRESYNWYKTMREGEYEYIHEYKERINEIMDLQRQHHEIIIKNQNNPALIQTSLAELHKLSITLSNLYDIAPAIGTSVKNDNTIPLPQKDIIV